MSSESNDHKPESQEPGPSSGPKARQSARAPSTWGAVRDAVSSVHNLGALLGRSGVLYKVIRDLLPELRSSATVLRDLFSVETDGEDGATREVRAYGALCAERLQELLEATDLANDERDDLATRALGLAGQLEASSDLLALLDRATHPVPTSVSVQLMVRETGRLWGGTRGGEVVVRLDDATSDASIDVDPYVVGPLLSIVLGLASAAGAGDVVVRVTGSGAAATLSVDPSGPAEASFKTVSVRILPSVPPASKTAHQVASQIGAVLELSGAHAVLRFVPTPP
jgi:hypothetical protein